MTLHKNLAGAHLHDPKAHTHEEVDITDLSAIHDDVDGEIAAITEKVAPIEADLILIEDSDASNAKKYIEIGNLPGGIAEAIHSDVANEITAITAKEILDAADELLLEDSANSFNKKAVTAANIAAYIEAALNGPWLPLSAGPSYPLTGDLCNYDPSDPTIILAQSGAATQYAKIFDNYNNSLHIQRYSPANSSIHISPVNTSLTGDVSVGLFLETETAGNSDFLIYRGIGTAEVNHRFRANGNTDLCLATGDINIGGSLGDELLNVFGPMSCQTYLKIPYLGAAPAVLTNGKIWMESDGLHIYYNGAEKVVAGV